MVDREEFELRSLELIEKTANDIVQFRGMFNASAEGMIRMMLLLWYVKTTLPDIYNQVDDVGKLTAMWLSLGSPEDGVMAIAELLRSVEGMKH